MTQKKKTQVLLDELLLSIYRGFEKLNPFSLYRNPIIFMTEIGAVLTTLQFIFLQKANPDYFALHVSFWLWTIVIFSNIAESFAEIRGEKTTDLRKSRALIFANLYDQDGNLNVVSCKDLKMGDLVLIRKDELIPADGEIISGFASIDESLFTGETQPIVRRAMSATRNVLAGTKVISQEIVVKVTANPGAGILDKMIDLIESATRKKTHNELAVTILLSNLCIIFLVTVTTFQFFGIFYNAHLDLTMQIALLASLIPTTIAGLLNAVSIAGINRLMKKNVVAKSGQAIEAAGEVDVIFLDKTGTITDKIKMELADQFREFKLLGLKTVIITGDNPLTAAVLAKDVKADDFLASASPEVKLHFLRQQQLEGHSVAMTGDGLNDVPALAAADLAIAMNDGTQAAKEAANMIDLDSHPSKLFEIIQIGKELLMTRGVLMAFTLGSDIAKYFVLLPALLIPVFPGFSKMNFLHLSSPKNTILSGVIFNAFILILLIPLSFRGVKLVPDKVNTILKKNLLIYGLGGIIFPFIGIKCIDAVISHWFI